MNYPGAEPRGIRRLKIFLKQPLYAFDKLYQP
jgi:hypothetical protein